MPLSPGTRLGPYQIVAPLGAGGMGEVYRATDTRLGRDVAIKVLPQHLSAHPELRARFEREARTISALNHPHICTLHDVGSEGDTNYLVMELIEGETLAARLQKGALPLADVLRIGGQIADALDRAHRAGVTHRDLKPGNVMLTKSGAKLLDFGLASGSGLGPASDLTSSPTKTTPLTAEGTIVGTFQYMAPEQLEGKDADARTDLWALGCVLYEMATGQRAFDGKSQASLITAIMGSEPPPISRVTPVAPEALERLVASCLAKDPADRIQSAHDVKLNLSWIAAGGSQSGASAVAGVPHRTRRAFGTVGALVAAAVLLLALAAGYAARGGWSPKGASPAEIRYKGVTLDEGFVFAARFEPDGRTIVYSADWDGQPRNLYVASLDSPDYRALGFTGADLLGVSRTGELALLAGSSVLGGNPYSRKGTLSRASLTGDASRPELEDVRFGDFGPDGGVAVVHAPVGRQTLEYPIGHTIVDYSQGNSPTRTEASLDIVNPRISPSGEYVAFFDCRNPIAYVVRIVDRAGKTVAISSPYRDWWGIAWASANEVWFAGFDTAGSQTSVMSLDLRGRQRCIFRAPGELTLHDVSAHHDMLASFDHGVNRFELADHADGPPTDRSWRGSASIGGFNADHTFLFSSYGYDTRKTTVFVWKSGAPQPVRIAEGQADALSPDGNTALVDSQEFPPSVSLVPTGVGTVRVLSLGAVRQVNWAGFRPNGRLVIQILRPDKGSGIYDVSPDGGAPVRILSADLQLRGNNLISPDGTRIVATDSTGHLMLCSLATGAAEPVPGALPIDRVAGWTADGTALYVYPAQVESMQVEHLDLRTGARTLWKVVRPNHPAVTGLASLIASPDGVIAYKYRNVKSGLYVIQGLR